ncbi:MAG: TIM barrel protein [Firmicutes bacterium]|nr:TIM barrel protein [Bacillota bacterium]
MDYGLQLYSVKDFMAKDVKGTIAQVAAMGYKVVEPAGFFGVSAEDFKAYCDEAGVVATSTHTGIGELTDENFPAIVQYLKTIGCKRYIIPGAPTNTKEELDNTIAIINKYQPMLAAEGLELMYHNHSREFLPNEDGIFPHLEMQKRTTINFQIDVYWTYRAGLNPLYILESLKDRITIIHLKDGTMEHDAPLGEGTTPIAEIVDWALANDVDIVVENEPTAERQMIEAEICSEYLKKL